MSNELWDYVGTDWGTTPEKGLTTAEVKHWRDEVWKEYGEHNDLKRWVDREGRVCLGRDSAGNPMFREAKPR